MKKNKKKDGINVLVVLMIICVILSLTMLAIVAYDKIIKTQPCSCNDVTAKCWSN